uniref:replicative DNA helicase n=1 Tax=Alicyclobacillus kakegawensis TaxID=392012 RepID=UPI00082F7438
MSTSSEQPTVGLIDSVVSEQYLVGAVLSDGAWIDVLRPTIRPDMFSVRWLGAVWKRMCDLAANGHPVDYMAFCGSSPDIVQKVGIERLANLMQAYVGEREVYFHADRLREAHMRRYIVRESTRLMERAQDMSGTRFDELRAAIESIAMATSDTDAGEGLRAGADEAGRWLDGIERKYKDKRAAYGFLTGWTDLDEMTLGFHRGDLIIVGGRTSVGKSAFATELVLRMQRVGTKVAVFSLEMSREQVQNRIAANIAGVPLSKIRTGDLTEDQLVKVSSAIDVIADVPIDDARSVTGDYIAAEMKRWKRTHGLDVVIVDYLQEIKEPPEPNDNAGSAYGRVARKLRKAAQQCDCAVIALSQLLRDAEGGKPQLRHLYGSSGIESAADVIILLHRDKEEAP